MSALKFSFLLSYLLAIYFHCYISVFRYPLKILLQCPTYSPFLLTSRLQLAYTASLYGSPVCICLCNSKVIGWSSLNVYSWINQSLPFENQITIKLLWPFFLLLPISSHNMAKAKTITKRKSIQSLQPHTNHGMETAQDNLPQSLWKITTHLLVNSHHVRFFFWSVVEYPVLALQAVLNNILNKVSDMYSKIKSDINRNQLKI